MKMIILVIVTRTIVNPL